MLSVCLQGCALAVNPTHQPGLVDHWEKNAPLPRTAAPPIALEIHTRRTFYDDQPSPSWMMTKITQQRIEKTVLEVATQFPVLQQASVQQAMTPYRIVVEATDAHYLSRVRSTLSALVFYIIPYARHNVLRLKANVYHDTQLLQTYEAVGSYDAYYHLIFILPLAWRPGMSGRVMEDTVWDLFLQIQQDASALFRSPQAAH